MTDLERAQEGVMKEWVPPSLEEAKEKLAKMFLSGAGFVAIYSRRERWALEAVALMQKAGYLGPCVERGDEQSTMWRFYFTEKAAKEFGHD